MNSGLATGGPSFGLAILAPATVALLVLVVVAGMRIKSAAGRFVIAALWARYIFGAYHVYMFKPLAAGLSGNALTSIAITGIGLLVIHKRNLLLAALLPIYLLILLIFVSAGLNGDMMGAVGVAVKYAYFAVLMVATFEALRQDEDGTLVPLLLWAFAPLLLFQWLSLALGLPKGSETGDGVVWIGGFNHEAAFSMALSAAFVAGCLAYRLHPALRFGFMVAALTGIVLAGYRTAIAAMAPLAFATFWAALPQYVKRDQRRAVGAISLIIAVAGAAAFAVLYHDRFTDVVTFLSDPGSLIKDPRSFTQVERQIMSGRAVIWSQYIYAYSAGQPFQLLIGFGPESWANDFTVYPHNTLIGTLYELGGIGFGAMLLLWLTMAGLALRARGEERLILLSGHFSFIVLNFATMPFWQVEGLALYGLLCGYTLFSARAAVFSRRAAISGSVRHPPGNRGAGAGTRPRQSGIPHSRYSHQ